MTKYVVPIDTPPPGQDWSTVVPGIYLWDVIGITAELVTGTQSLTVCPDASGNGNDLTYSSLGPWTTSFVPGLVAGDQALESGDPSGVSLTQVTGDVRTIDWTTDFTILWWMSNNTNYAGSTAIVFQAVQAGPGPSQVLEVLASRGPFGTLQLDDQANPPWVTVPGTCPDDGLAHFFAVTSGADGVNFYVDGAPVALAATGDPPAFPVPLASTRIGGPAQCAQIIDEVGIYNTEGGPVDIANIYALASVSYAAYLAEVLGFNPVAYYQMDGGTPSTGRQPTLIVSNGTDNVLAIPTGFEAVTTPGPYSYAWQPGLNADTQSSDGTLTTVAIPALAIPAGYTVGTRTLDLQPTDQWSNVSLWWDDSLQQVLANIDPYAYAGAHLQYRQIGH